MKRLFTLLIITVMVVIAWAQPTAVKNRAFYEGISYSWPFNAPVSAQQTSNLGEIATDPDQIIAMMREVYKNKNIPGNYTRGYSALNTPEGTWSNGVATGNYPVAYPAVGTIAMDANADIGYNNSYGWNVDGVVYKQSPAGTVSFTRANDRTRASYVRKNGITLNMYQLYGNSGTTQSPTYYFNAGSSQDIVVEAEADKVITSIKFTFVSGYTPITSAEATGGSGSYSSGTWTGSAQKVTFKHSSAVRLTQVDVSYESVGPLTTFEGAYETVTYIPGTDLGNNVNSGGTTGTKSVKGGFYVDYMSSGFGSSTSTWYQAASSYDARFFTYDGYTITNMNFTLISDYGTGTANDGSNLMYIKYLNGDGAEVSVTKTSSPSFADLIASGNLSFSDNGLSMTLNIPTKKIWIKPANNKNLRFSKIEATYKYDGPNINYFAPETYLPNEEGNTLLLVEVKDGVTPNTLKQSGLATFTNNTFDYYNITDYNSLRNVVDATIKSVRVVTESKRMGEGIDAGTLFKIDCDKLNRFFLLGKGQLRYFNNDYSANDVNASTAPRSVSQSIGNQPYWNGAGYFDQSIEALFGHMFEQFSPSMAQGGSSLNDIYQLLVKKMVNFNVVHDCIDVLSAESTGHEFNMYGKTSTSEDCQDVRDLMFFVPDYRMLAHEGNADVSKRDPNKAQRYVYYNSDHAPKMGLFVIKLDEISEDKAVKVDGQDAYDVTLTWNSNLLDFLPGEDGVYELYRVTNVNGTETYTPVTDGSGNPVTITANTQAGLTYTDRVAQLPNEGQTITYVVRGRDASNFLSLQMSNKESVYIPGIDVSEDLNLKLKADYYSRFDPQEEKNNYSNLVTMGTVVSNITSEELQQGTLTFTRAYTDATGNHCDPIAVGTVTSMANGSGTMTVVMQNQDFFKYGYNSNGTASASAPNPTFTAAFTYNANGVTFTGDGIKFYDNFSVSVADNAHPSKYTYQVNFVFGDKYANSNTMDIYVHKTQLVMDPEGNRSVTADQIASDDEKIDRALPANGPIEFGIDVKYSSKSEILRYDAYRWLTDADRYIIEPSSAANNEQDVAPNGIAGNQGTYYTTAMNAVAGADVPVTEGQTAQALFSDPYPVTNVGSYIYAPVVETFAPNENRTDYNTYGAPLQQAATGKIAVSVLTPNEDYPFMSDHTWAETNGDQYAYYNIYLQVDQSSIPQGYSIYKVRAWRKVDPSLLGEEFSQYYYRMGIDGEYLYEELDNVELDQGDILGTNKVNGQLCCTFGARKLRTSENEDGVIDDLKAEFVVRIYFTPTVSTSAYAPMLKSDSDANYYVIEATTERTFNWQEGIITGVARLTGNSLVDSVTYYNVSGAASSRPWPGVNIVVTRYSDGTITKTKVIK
ncbi:MAG: hypothetical protein IKX31_02005 [Muribaculaceae bacterium]|nr:hypothetical protein [Muribaculaceae bacterium]